MGRWSSDLDNFTRRKVVAGGLVTIITAGWLVSSIISDSQEPTTSPTGPTPVSSGSGTGGSDGSGSDAGDSGTDGSDTDGSDTDGSDTGDADTDGSDTETPGPQSSPQSGTNVGDGPQPPEILLVSLLSEWNGGDQMEKNRTDSIAKGERATIGYRYRAVPDDGEIELSVSVEVAGNNQNRIVSRSVEGSGPVVNEAASSFPTSEWSPGTKQAQVVIRDSNTGYVSAPAETEFEVTDG